MDEKQLRKEYILEKEFVHEKKDAKHIHEIYLKVLNEQKNEDIAELYLALRDKYVYIPMNDEFKAKHSDRCISSEYALENSFLEDAFIIPDETAKVGCFLTREMALNSGPDDETFLCYTRFHNLLLDYVRINHEKLLLSHIMIDPFQDDYAIYLDENNLQLFYGLECAIFNAPDKYLKNRID